MNPGDHPAENVAVDSWSGGRQYLEGTGRDLGVLVPEGALVINAFFVVLELVAGNFVNFQGHVHFFFKQF